MSEVKETAGHEGQGVGHVVPLKLLLAVGMLALAPRLVQPLSWPALLVAMVACLKVYWLALLWRGR